MDKNAHNKPVTFETPIELGAKNQPEFNKQDFDDSVYTKGYDVYIEKAIKCACVLKANGDALPNCRNCGGTKWVFVNKRLTKAVMQSMNKQTKFLNWSEVDRGTVSITVRDDDKLAFMDRVTNLNLVSTYSETLQIKQTNNKLLAYTIYPIIVPTECYLFEDSDKPLKQLQLNTDFTISDNKFILNDSYKQYSIEELSVSVRYTHFPQYHVLDINRDAMANLGAMHSCENPDLNKEYSPLLISAVARKAHYTMDESNIDGESLYDNSYSPNNSLTIMSESLPFSLDYWITRSSAAAISQSLLTENDTAKMNSIKGSLP